MSQRSLELHRDYQDMLAALNLAGAEYLVIGGFAVAAHGFVRTTKDLDLWVRAAASNAPRVLRALDIFGAPRHGTTEKDFAVEGTILQIGVAPRRIDVLTGTQGVTFDEAWSGRMDVAVGDMRVPVIGLEALLKNKRAVGRPEDKKDVRALEELHGLVSKRKKQRRPASKSGRRRSR